MLLQKLDCDGNFRFLQRPNLLTRNTHKMRCSMISILKKWGIKLLSFLLAEEKPYIRAWEVFEDGDKIEYVDFGFHYTGVLKIKEDGRYLINDELELLLPHNESNFYQTVYKVAQEESK